MNTKELKITQEQMELLQKIQEQEISYIENDLFSDPQSVVDLFLCAVDLPDAPDWTAYDAMQRHNKQKVVLSDEQERSVFLQYNFACKRVINLRENVSTLREVEALFYWYEKMQELRSYIAACNMRLISHLIHKWSGQKLDWHELVSEGQMALLQAIEKFDTAQGKFSTYLWYAINNAFGRLNKNRARANEHFSDVDSGDVDVIDDKQDEELAFRLDALHQILDKNIADLNEDELAILRMRYLDTDGKRPSIEKVSENLEMNKHKVTRCEKNALEKIRLAFMREFVHNAEKIGPKDENESIIECTSENTENRRRIEMTDEATVETAVESKDEATTEETAPKAEKKQLFKIWVDGDGNEVKRAPLGPGKPPKDSKKDADGNLICPVTAEKVKVNGDYVVLDENGNELSREPRKAGKGRPKKGFKKATEGDLAGDYIRQTTKAEWDAAKAEADAEAAKAAQADETEPETQDAPEVVEGETQEQETQETEQAETVEA